jgi:hypothetical protein
MECDKWNEPVKTIVHKVHIVEALVSLWLLFLEQHASLSLYVYTIFHKFAIYSRLKMKFINLYNIINAFSDYVAYRIHLKLMIVDI